MDPNERDAALEDDYEDLLAEKIAFGLNTALDGVESDFSVKAPPNAQFMDGRYTEKTECTQCGGVGHVASECSSPFGAAGMKGRDCLTCLGKGHAMSDCPNTRRVGDDDGMWECESCGNVNGPERLTCNRCKMGRAPPDLHSLVLDDGTAPPAKRDRQQPDWHCECGMANKPFRGACVVCERPKPVDLDVEWVCQKCTNVNWAARVTCTKCESSKPLYLQELQQGAKMTPTSSVNPYHAAAAAFAALGGGYAAGARAPATHQQQRPAVRSPPRAPRGPPMPPMPPYAHPDLDYDLDYEYPPANASFFSPRELPPVRYRNPAPPIRPPIRGEGKMREWLCACGNPNFAFRTKCKRCDAQRPQATTCDEDWICPCGNVAWGSRDNCIKCGQDKPEHLRLLPPSGRSLPMGQSRGPPPYGASSYGAAHSSYGAPSLGSGPKSGSRDWPCSCGNINFAFRLVCNRCQAPRPALGDGPNAEWLCACGNLNWHYRTACNKCKLARPI